MTAPVPTLSAATFEIHRIPETPLPTTRTAFSISHDRGALLLRDAAGEAFLIYAPGTWSSAERLSGEPTG